MNEVVVQGPRRGHGGGISLEVRVDGSLYSGGHAAASRHTPANTPAGRVLNDSTAFRDALRIRAYLRVADRLERVSGRSGDVTVTASLPAVSNSAVSERRNAASRSNVLGRT